MKKMLGTILVFISFTLVGCSSRVTTEDLKANDWSIEQSGNKDEELKLIASFTDHVMTMSIDTSSMKSTATNELEKIGEEFGEALIKQMSFKYEYELSGDKLTLTDTEENESSYYIVSKDEKNIVFEPDSKKDNKDSVVKLVLTPYKKPTKTTTTSTESTSSSTKESTFSTSESSSSEEQEMSSSVDLGLQTSDPNRPSVKEQIEAQKAQEQEENYYSDYSEESQQQNQAEQNEQKDQNQNQQDQNAQTGEQYITVQNGEGPNQVAARAGISVDQLYQLNGIDPNNFLFNPGMQLRIK
ncbi:LysM peptidoglycan-binding domain-containing protein [Enterococcus dispar]|uniref:LysM peptidoglycan-binding domain-containing protein n=1 Tax=Enterococcus TaxID=1350 RepID=UPI003981F549